MTACFIEDDFSDIPPEIDYSTLLHYPDPDKGQPAPVLGTRIMARTQDTNSSGIVFGGWIFSQMDTGVGMVAQQQTSGPVATASITDFVFLDRMHPGEVISVFCHLHRTGRSSICFRAEAWAADYKTLCAPRKVAAGLFTFVAVDDKGRPRSFSAVTAT